MSMRETELLIPAGSPEVLKIAVLYGADAVYIGGEEFSLRSKARNFSPEEMREGIRFAHEHGVKVYVAVNIFAHEKDLGEAERYLKDLRELSPDGLIVSDPGIFTTAMRVWPDARIHISTQASCTNSGTFLFWYRLGVRRIVAARELTLDEIRDIRAAIPNDMEIECFVHGAMCISYSGRCLLSNYLAGTDANRGACTHPCRWKYALMEEMRPGEYFPVEEDDGGTTILSSRDLCMIDHIPELIDAGIDSFKVEGRMKTALYTATVTRAYRRAIDDYRKDPKLYEENLPWYSAEVKKCTQRLFTTGFFYGKPGPDSMIYEGSTYLHNYTYLGTVQGITEDRKVRLIQKNKFSVGEEVELMKPDGRNIACVVASITDEAGDPMESAPHPGQSVLVDIGVEAEPYDILRREERTVP